MPIRLTLHTPINRRRYTDMLAIVRGTFDKVIIVVAFIGYQRLERKAFEQRNRLRFVVAFAARQDKPQRITKCVNGDVNLGGMSAARTP